MCNGHCSRTTAATARFASSHILICVLVHGVEYFICASRQESASLDFNLVHANLTLTAREAPLRGGIALGDWKLERLQLQSAAAAIGVLVRLLRHLSC